MDRKWDERVQQKEEGCAALNSRALFVELLSSDIRDLELNVADRIETQCMLVRLAHGLMWVRLECMCSCGEVSLTCLVAGAALDLFCSSAGPSSCTQV